MGDEIKTLCPGRTACSPDATVSVFRRPDVEGAYPAFTAGILAVVTTDAAEHFSLFGFKLRFPVRREDDGNFDTFLTEHTQRFGFLLENLPEDTPLRAIVAARLQPAPEAYKGARAFLEQTKGVPGHGGLAVGWAANLPGVRLCLIDPAGRIVPLARAPFAGIGRISSRRSVRTSATTHSMRDCCRHGNIRSGQATRSQ